MVARLAATVPVPKSAAPPRPAELTFLDADDVMGIVHLAAPSRHDGIVK